MAFMILQPLSNHQKIILPPPHFLDLQDDKQGINNYTLDEDLKYVLHDYIILYAIPITYIVLNSTYQWCI